MSKLLSVLALLLVFSVARATAPKPGYRIETELLVQADPPTPGRRLQLLINSFPPNPPNAYIRMTSKEGEELVTLHLEKRRAVLEGFPPGKGPFHAFLVTQDFSNEFGSYNGKGTQLIEINHDHFQAAHATDDLSGKEVRILLARTGKADWQVVPSQKKTADILVVRCEPMRDTKTGKFEQDPNTGALVFGVVYARFRHDGKKWTVKSRQVKGMWESDQPFPETSLFP